MKTTVVTEILPYLQFQIIIKYLETIPSSFQKRMRVTMNSKEPEYMIYIEGDESDEQTDENCILDPIVTVHKNSWRIGVPNTLVL